MGNFKFLPHTADIKVRVEGSDLPDLYRAALTAMNEILLPGFCKAKTGCTQVAQFELQSMDRTSLLIDFLSEILYFTEVRHAVFCEAEFSRLEEKKLSCTIKGEKITRLEEGVKAVTYHDAEVHRNSEGIWTTDIVFDI